MTDPMDHDAPEREELNAHEEAVRLGVSLRLMSRAALRSGFAVKEFNNAMVLASPLLDGNLDIDH